MSGFKFYPKLRKYCSTFESEFDQIDDPRREILAGLADDISKNSANGRKTSMIVICTHNSRRSHMGQLWLLAAAAYYGIDDVTVGSGGTYATAVNAGAVEALRDAGFRIQSLKSGENLPYQVSMGPKMDRIEIFSKEYNHRINPSSHFTAVMVCSEADASCPIVPGASARFAVPFEDPKNSDGTQQEKQVYAKTCREIGREMFYVMRLVKEKVPPKA